MNTNVYIQADIFQRQKYGGVKTVFDSIIKYNNDNRIFISDKYEDHCSGGGKSTFIPNTANKAMRTLTRDRFELLSGSYNNIHVSWLTIPLTLHHCKKIVTVHDLIPELGLQPVNKSFLRHRKLQYKWADILLCVSNTTAADLLTFYPDLKNKITVVYNGGYEGEKNVIDGPPRLVHIGTRHGYKNFQFLLQALDRCDRHLISKYEFHILGGGILDDAEKQQIAKLRKFFSRIVVKPSFNSSELEKVLTKRSIYISASRYEGFGIPVLEAYSYGSKILLSNIPVYRELFATIAEYFDLSDPTGLSMLLNDHMSNNTNVCNDHKIEFIQNLTWQNMAKRVHNIYND